MKSPKKIPYLICCLIVLSILFYFYSITPICLIINKSKQDLEKLTIILDDTPISLGHLPAHRIKIFVLPKFGERNMFISFSSRGVQHTDCGNYLLTYDHVTAIINDKLSTQCKAYYYGIF